MYEPETDMENDGYEVPNLVLGRNSSETLTEQDYSDSANNNSMKSDEANGDNVSKKNNVPSQENVSTES